MKKSVCLFFILSFLSFETQSSSSSSSSLGSGGGGGGSAFSVGDARRLAVGKKSILELLASKSDLIQKVLAYLNMTDAQAVAVSSRWGKAIFQIFCGVSGALSRIRFNRQYNSENVKKLMLINGKVGAFSTSGNLSLFNVEAASGKGFMTNCYSRPVVDFVHKQGAPYSFLITDGKSIDYRRSATERRVARVIASESAGTIRRLFYTSKNRVGLITSDNHVLICDIVGNGLKRVYHKKASLGIFSVVSHPQKEIIAISLKGSQAVGVFNCEDTDNVVAKAICATHAESLLLFLSDGTLVTQSTTAGGGMQFWDLNKPKG